MKILKKTIRISLFTVILLSSCISVRNTPKKRIVPLYNASISDAAYPAKEEIAPLTQVSKNNTKLSWKTIEGKEYLLVTTWTSEQSVNYYPKKGIYNTKSYPIWVTAIPDLRDRCDVLKVSKSKDPSLRIKQLLGLPPTADKTYFIEFWVQPTDLFRPCASGKITDKTCGLCFLEDGVSKEIFQAHKTWINQLRISSYYTCKGDKYPWTQLGYTYDWHPRNKSHIGISEFVIKENSDIYVNKIAKTNDYLDL